MSRELQTSAPRRARRLSAEDWIAAATEALRQGVAAVAVEPLAERLNVTRGSFYAHFATREELLKAVLERWRIAALAAAAQSHPGDAHQRLAARLNHMFTDRENGEIHAQLCASSEHPVIGPVHVEIALAEIDSLSALYHAAGLAEGDARQRALITYTAYMGYWRSVTVLPKIPAAQRLGADPSMFDGYSEHVVSLLVPTPPAEATAGGAAPIHKREP